MKRRAKLLIGRKLMKNLEEIDWKKIEEFVVFSIVSI